jgi:hypothetical protein
MLDERDPIPLAAVRRADDRAEPLRLLAAHILPASRIVALLVAPTTVCPMAWGQGGTPGKTEEFLS